MTITLDHDPNACEICGEPFGTGPEAEMYDPATEDVYVCHAECGLARNYEVA